LVFALGFCFRVIRYGLGLGYWLLLLFVLLGSGLLLAGALLLRRWGSVWEPL
jgi:hypothetical protein